MKHNDCLLADLLKIAVKIILINMFFGVMFEIVLSACGYMVEFTLTKHFWMCLFCFRVLTLN
jgi:hypothetical protein